MALVTVCLLSGCSSGASPADPGSAGESAVQTAPDSVRIDLATPTFSDSTNITNPRFPITELAQVIQVGTEGEVVLRQEVTLLPEIKTIEWEGQQVDTVVSQFIAYGDGRVLEVARDFFAQADDGSVWYFGEDVENYIDGELADTDGTWLAGRDGPPGMIMPADPQVGDVYRPENIPGFVFEETTVKSVTETVDGPQGSIADAMLVEELSADGALENKIFAPGYGEFMAQVPVDEELVYVSIGVPLDAVGVPLPAEVAELSDSSADLYAAAGAADWTRVMPLLDSMSTAWTNYRGTGVPPLTADGMDVALEAVGVAAGSHDVAATQQAAGELAYVVTDLRLRHEEPAAVDLLRMNIVVGQLQLDSAAEKKGFVLGDTRHLEALWARISHTVDTPAASVIEATLAELRSSAESADYATVATVADALSQALSSLSTGPR